MKRALWILVLFLGGASLFAAAYGQAPLFYSNQNQYCLHGMSQAGHGNLTEDWLAQTLDPTPVFSLLVFLTGRFLGPWCFHVYHAVLLGAYAAAMLSLFVAIVGQEMAARRWPLFLALLVLFHAAAARWLCYRLVGQDYPWYFQAGVAGQYVLGAMFQPSTFGVLLLVALALFVWERPVLAGLAVALAATFHSTYLLSGAFVVLGFLTALIMAGRRAQALALAGWALALVLPVTIFVVLTFRPTSPGDFDASQAVLVDLRIPHHARPDLWFDAIAALQIGWLALGVLLAWGRLWYALAIPFAMAAALTLVQVGTGNHTLALLFPWRISAILVPSATTVILARLTALPGAIVEGRLVWGGSFLALASLVSGGIWIMAERHAFRSGDEEIAMMEFVRTNLAPGQVFLVPVRLPDLARSTRGSSSSDFKPLAEKKTDKNVIPLDLQRFRLHTGAPIFVDFKSIPYKDTEVLEWRRRLFLAAEIQELLGKDDRLPALTLMRRAGITHLVFPANKQRAGPGLRQVYEDPYYRVYVLQ